jgi:hypothetical protein
VSAPVIVMTAVVAWVIRVRAPVIVMTAVVTWAIRVSTAVTKLRRHSGFARLCCAAKQRLLFLTGTVKIYADKQRFDFCPDGLIDIPV